LGAEARNLEVEVEGQEKMGDGKGRGLEKSRRRGSAHVRTRAQLGVASRKRNSQQEMRQSHGQSGGRGKTSRGGKSLWGTQSPAKRVGGEGRGL